MDSFFYAGEALLWKNLRWTFVCSFYYGSIYIKKGLPGGSDGKAEIPEQIKAGFFWLKHTAHLKSHAW